jgi:hypothetical protein
MQKIENVPRERKGAGAEIFDDLRREAAGDPQLGNPQVFDELALAEYMQITLGDTEDPDHDEQQRTFRTSHSEPSQALHQQTCSANAGTVQCGSFLYDFPPDLTVINCRTIPRPATTDPFDSTDPQQSSQGAEPTRLTTYITLTDRKHQTRGEGSFRIPVADASLLYSLHSSLTRTYPSDPRHQPHDVIQKALSDQLGGRQDLKIIFDGEATQVTVPSDEDMAIAASFDAQRELMVKGTEFSKDPSLQFGNTIRFVLDHPIALQWKERDCNDTCIYTFGGNPLCAEGTGLGDSSLDDSFVK